MNASHSLPSGHAHRYKHFFMKGPGDTHCINKSLEWQTKPSHMLEKLYNIKINVNLPWHYFQARSNIQFRYHSALSGKQHDQVGEWNMKKGVERGCHCKTEDHWAGPKNKYTMIHTHKWKLKKYKKNEEVLYVLTCKDFQDIWLIKQDAKQCI